MLKFSRQQLEQATPTAQTTTCLCNLNLPSDPRVPWLAAVVYLEAHPNLTSDYEREAIAWATLNRVRYARYLRCFWNFFSAQGQPQDIVTNVQTAYNTEMRAFLGANHASIPDAGITVMSVTSLHGQYPSVMSDGGSFTRRFDGLMPAGTDGVRRMNCSWSELQTAGSCPALQRAVAAATRVQALSDALGATTADPMRVFAGISPGPPSGYGRMYVTPSPPPSGADNITTSLSAEATSWMPSLIGFVARADVPRFGAVGTFDYTTRVLYSDGGSDSMATRGQYQYVNFYTFHGRERSRSTDNPKPVTFSRLTIMNYDTWGAGVVYAVEAVPAAVPQNYCVQSASTAPTGTPAPSATPRS